MIGSALINYLQRELEQGADDIKLVSNFLY
jgi:hypothetical protein